jgi:hypothetical protein
VTRHFLGRLQVGRGAYREAAHAAARALRGIFGAIRARPKVFAGVVAAVFLFDLVAPVAILSLARRPLDFFSFNPWLSRLPEYLASDAPFAEKVAFLSRMAIAWTSSDSPVEGLEWGVVIDVPSLARILVTSLTFGAYFALWSQRRRQALACGRGSNSGRPLGVAGAVTSVVGLTTGPCSVAGCGVPVLPVVGLAFTGISSRTLSLFTNLSRVSFDVVLATATVAVIWLGWRAGTQSGRYASGTP